MTAQAHLASSLHLEGVSKEYGGVPVLTDFNLTIRRGEFISLLGPSGCGKTTTLRMIAGFVCPDAGVIRHEGRTLFSATEDVPPEKRNMGMVFQSYAVWPHMTVRQNIELPLRLRRLPSAEVRQRTNDVLQLCRLDGFADRDPHQLSGGQLQRVALARALTYHPEIVLLDEPLSNLDIALREDLRRELYTVHKKTGATFILVTHDQVEAMSLSDRVVVMRHGRIEQVGTPEEIYQSPRTEFVAQFVGSANLVPGIVASAPTAADPDHYQVRCGALNMDVRPGITMVEGRPVTVALHPEAIRLLPPGEQGLPSEQRFAGTVRAAQFLGRTQEFTVDVDGVELRATQLRGVPFEVGAAVSVTFARDAAIPLTR